MDIKADDTDNLRGRLYSAIKKAADDSGVVIHTIDGKHFAVRGDVFLGHDVIEFRADASGKIIVPFDKIIRVMVG
jgi:hypothetical protein